VRIKGTFRNCENVVGFGSHKPKRRTLHAGHLRTHWSKGDSPTELLKNCRKEFGKHAFITKFIYRYKTKMKGTLKITKLKRHCAALY
jgi:hypothetical protein